MRVRWDEYFHSVNSVLETCEQRVWSRVIDVDVFMYVNVDVDVRLWKYF